MSRIFISYRREDSQATSDHIFDWLSQRFGRNAIVYDVESIPPGVDFASYIHGSIHTSSVVLVIIGAQWLSLRREGKRRLDDPDDYVRREIETALQQARNGKGPLIVPILVDGATMPGQAMLPPSIADLAGIQSLAIRRNPDFERDISHLYQIIAPYMRPANATFSSPPPPPQTDSSTTPLRRQAVRPSLIIVGLIVVLGIGLSFYQNQKKTMIPWPKDTTAALITASIPEAIQQCATAATSAPANCPQRILSGYSGSRIVWTLHGDPSTATKIIYDGNNHFTVVGTFFMTVTFDVGVIPNVETDIDDYQATVIWDPTKHAATVSTLGTYTSTSSFFTDPKPKFTIARPSQITDAAALTAVKAQFNYCAAQTIVPSLSMCPPFGDHNYRFTGAVYILKDDPTSTAHVTYDSDAGIVHVVGSYAMGVTYASVTDERNGNYEAYLTVDAGKVTVAFVKYS